VGRLLGASVPLRSISSLVSSDVSDSRLGGQPAFPLPALLPGTGDLRLERTFEIAGVGLEIASGDPGFLSEFESVFGGGDAAELPAGAPRLRVRLSTGEDGWGEIEASGDALDDPGAFLEGLSSPDIPIRTLESPVGWRLLGVGDAGPVFAFSGGRTFFRQVPRWRRILSHFFFLRALRLRADALFFHAASVEVGGTGAMLVGPKGSGKSTLALALAFRGHGLLGDETACYTPRTGKLSPMLRPLGIKPGPRSAAVERAVREVGGQPDPEGVLRVPSQRLLPRPRPAPVPLKSILFLRGFGEDCAVRPIAPGREELSQLQPLASSLSSGPAVQRVFEMVRLLGSVRVYSVTGGTPDQTAEATEEVLES
jgi:hypothetical protein